MKFGEPLRLSILATAAARAGEIALTIDIINFVLPEYKTIAQGIYRGALNWLNSESERTVLKEVFGKIFRIEIANDISEMVKTGRYSEAKSLFNEFEDHDLMPLLIELIPEDQRHDLSDKPTIDAVLKSLSPKVG
jgi:hypothetical protein